MRRYLFNILDELQASYWYIPSVMAIFAVIGAIFAVTLDQFFSLPVSDYIPVSSDPAGTRDIMSALAGSILSIAATSFSITIVAMTLASQQFGPRLLDNFMRDRGNQIVLGIFIAVPTYCLIVLWSIQSTEGAIFVPELAVIIGVILGAVSFGALIYFIHHTAESIRVSTILNRVAQDMISNVDSLYPSGTGVSMREHALPDDFEQHSMLVTSTRSGYVQRVDLDSIFRMATGQDLVIQLLYNPGDFVTQQMPLAYLYPKSHVDNETIEKVTGQIILTSERSQTQDIEFLFRKISETGIRALSPGVNDPYTAIMALDHLGAMLSSLVRKQFASPYRGDENHRLRLVLPALEIKDIIHISFQQMLHYGRDDLVVLTHIVKVLDIIRIHAHRQEDIEEINTYIERTYNYIREIDPDKWDYERAGTVDELPSYRS